MTVLKNRERLCAVKTKNLNNNRVHSPMLAS